MSRWGIIDKTLEGRFETYFPHQHRVPRDLVENLRYRQRIRAVSSEKERQNILRMCSEDFLFYLMSFVWIFRATKPPGPVPFIPYDFQFELFTVMWHCLHDDQQDLRILKPRDMGASWGVMALFDHAWHWRTNVHILIGSRRAEELDGTRKDASGGQISGEWAKLLPKMDFIHLHLPRWMWPRGYRPCAEPYRTRLRIVNPENGSLVLGESANARFGRGGRFYVIGFDEHAHTEHGYEIVGSCSQTSDCHFWWSSPNGPATAHAMLGRGSIRNVSLKWWMHPLHAEDMTIDDSVADDRGRDSPWLQRKLRQIGDDPTLANNEIWAEEKLTTGSFYSKEVFARLLGVGDERGTVTAAPYRGELDYRLDQDGPWPTRWLDQEGGRWQLWLEFDAEGRPPHDDRYILGIDVATGTTDSFGRGASNSTIAVISELSRAKVAEYATHGVPPHKFALTVLAAARWFCGMQRRAFIIYDAAGSGSLMGDVLVKEYDVKDNMYWRFPGTDKAAPGYVRPGEKQASLRPWGQHVCMIIEGGYLERSGDAVDEMRYYYHNPSGGAPVHSASKNIKDPSGARENHGDRTTATVLACIELAKRATDPPPREEAPAYGSLLHAKALERKWELKKALI